MKNSAMVVHFDKDFWGKAFWTIPECVELTKLLDQSMLGIKFNDHENTGLATSIQQLEKALGFERIALLCQCLLLLMWQSNKQTLSTLETKDLDVFCR